MANLNRTTTEIRALLAEPDALFEVNRARNGRNPATFALKHNQVKMDAVETIFAGENTLAVIVRSWIDTPGISFFTPGSFSQQLAYMQHPPGKKIVPHMHNFVRREVTQTLEVLFVRKGRLRVDLYDDSQNYVESRILGAGDVILLVSGGHGFETLEPVEMFEVKQGPYAGNGDKTRIESAPPHRIQTPDEDGYPGERTAAQWKRKAVFG